MKIPFEHDGRLVPGTILFPMFTEETWDRYMLEDGTVIRTKHVLRHIVKLDEPCESCGVQYFPDFDYVLWASDEETRRGKEVTQDGSEESDRHDRDSGIDRPDGR